MRKLIQTQRELKTKLKIQKSHKFVREKNHSNSLWVTSTTAGMAVQSCEDKRFHRGRCISVTKVLRQSEQVK